MSVPRNFVFTVQAPATTVAQGIANQMAAARPSTPMWSSELSTPAYLAASTLNQVTPARGLSGSSSLKPLECPNPDYATIVGGWSGRSHYQSANGGEVWLCSGGTGRAAGNLTMVRYRINDDRFLHWQGNTAADTVNAVFPSGWGAPHNFDSSALLSGKIYRHMPDNGSTGTYANGLGIWDTATQAQGSVVEPIPGGAVDTYPPVVAYPTMGAQGSVLVFNSIGSAQRYDVASAAFVTALTTGAGSVAAGPVVNHNGEIYVLEDVGSRFYRLAWNGSTLTATQLASLPTTASRGGAQGSLTFACLVSLGSNIYCFAANTMKVYRFNGTAWSEVDDMLPVANTWAANQRTSFSAASLPDQNSVLFVRTLQPQQFVFTYEALLWKP